MSFCVSETSWNTVETLERLRRFLEVQVKTEEDFYGLLSSYRGRAACYFFKDLMLLRCGFLVDCSSASVAANPRSAGTPPSSRPVRPIGLWHFSRTERVEAHQTMWGSLPCYQAEGGQIEGHFIFALCLFFFDFWKSDSPAGSWHRGSVQNTDVDQI